MQAKEDSKILENKKKAVEAKEAFPGMTFADDELPDEEDDVEIFYIEEENEQIWELYSVVKLYLGEYYKLPENIILELIKEDKLPVKRTLQMLPYIHSGFVNIISPPETTKDG